MKVPKVKIGYKECVYGVTKCEHYFSPGIWQSDAHLNNLWRQLIDINKRKDNPIQHPFLDESADISKIRDLYSHAAFGVLYQEGELSGFLISPILFQDNKPIVHAGLVIICNNLGSNLIATVAAGNATLCFNNLGPYFSTNITSTPSIMEAFEILVHKPWPSPKASSLKPPKDYIPILHALFEQYITKMFVSPENIKLDSKRFVMSSKSLDMGFNTDFHRLSRSKDFSFMNFCFVWVDYQKEEDIIQVGKIHWPQYLKIWLIETYLKLKCRFSKQPTPSPKPQLIQSKNSKI